MNIAFDAKRIFSNQSGLGNYARSLVESLCHYTDGHRFHLFTPSVTDLFDTGAFNEISVHTPSGFFHHLIPSLWRSKGMISDLRKLRPDVYHGLSAELPKGIEKTGIPSVVSIHDLIYEYFPSHYRTGDRAIYRSKTRYACKTAGRILAMSAQTKKDLVETYDVPEEKIEVMYQSCHTRFREEHSVALMEEVKTLYDLPDLYFISVGSVIERKNLINTCRALTLMHTDVHLVVVGDASNDYAADVKSFIKEKSIEKRVHFLNDHLHATSRAYRTGEHLPALYRMSQGLLYPSLYEGFGIPILEALECRVPVITSALSCMPEVGGEAALYIDPLVPGEIAAGMQILLDESKTRNRLIAAATKQACKFHPGNIAAKQVEIYRSMI